MSHSYSASLIYGALAKPGSEAESDLRRRLEAYLADVEAWQAYEAPWFAVGDVWIFALLEGDTEGPNRFGLRAAAAAWRIDTLLDGAHRRLEMDGFVEYTAHCAISAAIDTVGLRAADFEEAGFLLAMEVWR